MVEEKVEQCLIEYVVTIGKGIIPHSIIVESKWRSTYACQQTDNH